MKNIFDDELFFDKLFFIIINRSIHYEAFFVFSSKENLSQTIKQHFGNQNVFAQFSLSELFAIKDQLENSNDEHDNKIIAFNLESFAFEMQTSPNLKPQLIPIPYSKKSTLSFIDSVLTVACTVKYNDVIFSNEVLS